MVTWLWNLIQGDFAQNPTAWMDLAITVLGIVLSPVAWFTSKYLEGKAAKREAKDAQEKFDAHLAVLKSQRDTADNMAKALRAQVEQLKNLVEVLSNADIDADPWGDAEWMSGDGFRIKNTGKRTVEVLSVHTDARGLPFDSRRHTPFRCPQGDSVEYLAPGMENGRAVGGNRMAIRGGRQAACDPSREFHSREAAHFRLLMNSIALVLSITRTFE